LPPMIATAADRCSAPTLMKREADRNRREEMVSILERAIEAGRINSVYMPERPEAVWTARRRP